jgi:hypothetical protein
MKRYIKAGALTLGIIVFSPLALAALGLTALGVLYAACYAAVKP